MKKFSFTTELPASDTTVAGFLKAFERVLENSNYRSMLDLYSRVSMNCSRCAEECQIFRASRDPRDIPCYRSALLLDIYRNHFTAWGLLKSRIRGTSPLRESDIEEMAESFYHCTVCGRCSIFCPLGIDHRLIVRLGRYILSLAGIAPKALTVSVKEQTEGATRNTSGVPLKALRDNLEFLEEEIQEIKGAAVKFPLDVKGAEYVFFAPVSDYLMEADTLMGIACVLQEAGVSWTICSENYDAINYGLFYNDEVLETITQSMYEAFRNIGGKKILIGECGHASRAASLFMSHFTNSDIPVVNIIELTARLIEEGRIELDPDAIQEKVTYHDPCNIARSGWIVEQPRRILRSFVRNFVEMDPHGTLNLCCGGGGGTVSVSEFKPYRMDIAGKGKADQLRASGAELVVTPCANCKKQISELIAHYRLPMRHAGLHDLLLTAIKLKKADGEG
ncbi:MAG: (Fe-S)-binding protein [Spirochaetes bacterium]|nr:(Fe-S)-binding protein [Spirochaetota bacterium]